MENAIFTDFATILFENGTEMLNQKFLTKLEKEILQDKAKDFKYDSENMLFTYTKVNDNCTYVGIAINTEKCKGDTIAEINRLIALETDRKNAKIMKKQAEELKRKQEEYDEYLISEAKKGNILSERARQLYLERLNEELSYLGKFEWFKDSENSYAFEYDAMELTAYCTLPLAILGFMGISTVGVSTISGLTKIIPIFLLIHSTINFGLVSIGKPSLLAKLAWSLFLNFKKLLKRKEYLEKRELIKYKIEWLEKYNITGEEVIKAYLSKISAMINELDEVNKRKFDEELTLEKQKYQAEEITAPTSGLNIESKEYKRLNFISYLTRLENRIDSVKNGATYEETIKEKTKRIAPIDHRMDQQSQDKTKKLLAKM